MNYTNREVVRRLKQYDMFLNSLNLTTNDVQRERICDQLDKIEKQILLETNTEYEEEYMLLLGENTKSFEEEKNRLRDIIALILDRRQYLEERKRNHKKVTGSLVELTTFLGEDKLSEFRKNLRIIEKYEENKRRQEMLIKDIKELDIKISEASRNVKANMRLNDSLENKMISLVDNTLKKLNLYNLIEERESLKKKYLSLEYACNLAKDNLKMAKESGNDDDILECDNLLSEIMIEYAKFSEKINILNLIDIFDKSIDGYEELLEKREKIDSILKGLTGSSVYDEISEEINKQYNTIKLEKQDIDNYEKLKNEREKKNKTLYSIEEENNSKEFKLVLEELIKSETKMREERIQKARKEEYLERQKKLLEDQKIEAARVKRQKLIEEARLKDQQERAEKLKELQEKTVITPQHGEKKEEFALGPEKLDTNELFENTKIVPNKVLEVENLDNLKLEELNDGPALEESDEAVDKPLVENTLEREIKEDNKEMPNIIDLFKENQAKSEKVELKEEDGSTSIYDILENNPNITWEKSEISTDTSIIPVIENNNLKPEIIDSKKENSFPEIGSKEGEILWKETI